MTVIQIVMVLAVLAAVLPADAADIYYPPSAFSAAGPGLVNVHRYGAKGDGVHDDTAALQQAITDNIGIDLKTNNPGSTLYFPAGTYLVSGTLFWRGKDGILTSWLSLQGQGRAKVVIRLKDSCPGFQDPAHPKAVLYTASNHPHPNFNNTPDDGGGNEGYRMNIEDLTVDVGKNNPGATAIKYQPNNMTAMRNVSLRSSDAGRRGAVGLHLYGWAGPTLIKNVSVQGFDVGVLASGGAVFEHLSLQGQRVVGMRFVEGVWGYGMAQSIRDLVSSNSVPVLENVPPDGDPARSGLITLVGAALTGGASNSVALHLDGGFIFARDVSTAGYKNALRLRGVDIPGAFLTEYSSLPPLTAGGAAPRTLRLPAEETPALFSSSNPADWANIRGFKQAGDPDDTAAFQRAIDSGRPIVYLPPGFYYLSNTVHIRGAVRRVAGMMSQVQGTPGAFADPAHPQPLLQVDKTNDGLPIAIDHLNIWPWGNDLPGAVIIQHASPNALVLSDLDLGHAPGYVACYRNTPGCGPLFVEDVIATKWRFDAPQNVWARHWDVEHIGPAITARGGTFWIFGLKSEGGITVLDMTEGTAELLGGTCWSEWHAADVQTHGDNNTLLAKHADSPLFVDRGGTFAAVFSSPSVSSYPQENGPYHEFVRSEGTGPDLTWNNLPGIYNNGSGKAVPLYVSAPAVPGAK